MITETRSTYQRQDDRLPLRGFLRSRTVVEDDTQLVKAHDRSDKPPVYLTGRRPGSCLPNEKDPVLESEDAEFEPRKTRRPSKYSPARAEAPGSLACAASHVPAQARDKRKEAILFITIRI